MIPHAAFTIVSRNYLGQALTLRTSFLRLHDNVDFYIVLVDRKDRAPEPDVKPAQLLWAEDLPIPNYWRQCFKFDVIEWSTAVKPFCAMLLLQKYNKVLYLDPDFLFYRNADWLFVELDDCQAIITPHATTPIYDDYTQGDLEWMRVGTFNLGFIGLARGPETTRFLQWWGTRCLSDGYLETQRGLAYDQKWLTLAIGFFPGIRILYHRGINAASWNLHERYFQVGRDGLPELTDGTPLFFFHFSGFDPNRPDLIHARQKRWSTSNRPDTEPLMANYAEALLKHGFQDYSHFKYNNDLFSDGTPIPPLLRRVYALNYTGFMDDDPFMVGSDIFKYAIARRLAPAFAKPPKRATADDLAHHGMQIRLIDLTLRFVARIIGPYRYFNLMKYLAHISSIRHQHGVFTPDQR